MSERVPQAVQIRHQDDERSRVVYSQLQTLRRSSKVVEVKSPIPRDPSDPDGRFVSTTRRADW